MLSSSLRSLDNPNDQDANVSQLDASQAINTSKDSNASSITVKAIPRFKRQIEKDMKHAADKLEQKIPKEDIIELLNSVRKQLDCSDHPVVYRLVQKFLADTDNLNTEQDSVELNDWDEARCDEDEVIIILDEARLAKYKHSKSGKERISCQISY